MAGYTTLKIGSSGEDVKKLQNALISQGYDLEGGADGIYGEKTAATVKQYQNDKGLTKDGVAGNQTLSSLYGASAGGNEVQLSSYEQAKKMLDEHLAAKPEDFVWQDQGLLDEARDKWMNRPDFQYDMEKDPFYQQYRDQYINQGQLAMLDTMGQAAALTGGYGSTYAQSAGQQAYQAYLQRLNEIAPELYGAAYDRYSAEGNELYQKLALLDAQRQQAYGEHQDNLDEWYTYLRDLNSNVQYEQQMEYQRERDAIEDAKWQQEYNLSQAKLYGDPGVYVNGDPYTAIAGSGSLDQEKIRMIQWSMGLDTTGVWNQETAEATGYKNSNDAYKAWVNGEIVNGKEWTTYYAPKLSAAQQLKTQLQGKSQAEKESAVMNALARGDIDNALAQELIISLQIR